MSLAIRLSSFGRFDWVVGSIVASSSSSSSSSYSSFCLTVTGSMECDELLPVEDLFGSPSSGEGWL